MCSPTSQTQLPEFLKLDQAAAVLDTDILGILHLIDQEELPAENGVVIRTADVAEYLKQTKGYDDEGALVILNERVLGYE